MKIFLDDIRQPENCLGYMYHRIGSKNILYLDKDWVVVKNYEQFKLIVEAAYQKFITITHISFDHDLADVHYEIPFEDWNEASSEQLRVEETGYDCAKYFLEYYDGFGDNPPVPFPEIFVHSMNPVGRERIESLFKS